MRLASLSSDISSHFFTRGVWGRGEEGAEGGTEYAALYYLFPPKWDLLLREGNSSQESILLIALLKSVIKVEIAYSCLPRKCIYSH